MNDAEKFRKWIVMLLSVNYTQGKMNIGNEIYTVEPGEALFSIQTWAEKLGTSKKGVLAFFELLKKDGMIRTEIVGKGNRSSTRVIIENYGLYQGDIAPQELPQTHRKSNRKGNREGITSKEGEERKEEKRKKEVIEPPLFDEVVQYFLENGYSKDAAKKAFDYYAVRNWHDKNGKKVNSWKQKMIANWFKDEYKIQTTPSTQYAQLT